MDFTGTLSIQIGTLPAVPAFASGLATVQFGPGNLATQIAIDAGAFATSITAPVMNVGAIIQIKLAVQNQAISFTQGGTCTANHPNVSCPGGGLGGFAGLSGTALVGIFFTTMHTGGSGVVTGTNPLNNLSVPLGIVGGGSTVVTTGQGIMVTVSGAGWTTGTAAALDPTGTVMVPIHLPGSTTGNITQTGLIDRFTGSNTLVGGRNEVSLVSPVQIFNNATASFFPSVARMSLSLPEPGSTVLLLASASVISALYGLRRMTRRR